MTLQKHPAGVKGHLFLLQRYVYLITLPVSNVNNKQDFVPPLVPGPDQYARFSTFLK